MSLSRQTDAKETVARAALAHCFDALGRDEFLGIGSGTTVSRFIEQLTSEQQNFNAAVSSSTQSTQLLQDRGIRVVDANAVDRIAVYVDGADEIDPDFHLVKGGGGALTREKILAGIADRFICIADETKVVKRLGQFPIPIEVIPMGRAFVSGEVQRLGGNPVLRENFRTDNNHQILDVHDLDISDPAAMEAELNMIPGVVTNGIFAKNRPHLVLVSSLADRKQTNPVRVLKRG